MTVRRIGERLRRLLGRAETLAPRTHETLEGFTEIAAHTLKVLRPAWTTTVDAPGRVRGADEHFDVRDAYAYHLSSGEDAREVISASLTLMLLSSELPAATDLLIPWLVPNRRLKMTLGGTATAIPATSISPALSEVLALACDGTARIATEEDLDTLQITWDRARRTAFENALDGVEVRVRPTAEQIWRIETTRGWPVTTIVAGSNLIRRAAATVGVIEPVCLLSSPSDLLVADLANASAVARLVSVARPAQAPVPPGSLGCIALSPGPNDDWIEVPVCHPESFLAASDTLESAYPNATLVRPSEKHDGRGRSFWIAEWALGPGRFILPAALDVVVASKPGATKAWESLPRSLSDIVAALDGREGTAASGAEHWVFDIEEPLDAYRRLARVALHDPLSDH